jgi:hypothetical protein
VILLNGNVSRKIFLTFDVEDFVKDKEISALKRILEILDASEAKGLFFITGHVAEKLVDHPEVVGLLENHEIGYHSTSHSTHPIIVEYTDIEDYNRAVELAAERETSSISSISGEIKGPGGILHLREVFPRKSILSFRAPGFSWSPPHLEALQKLGIRYDFSASLASGPLLYKGLSFYPFPIVLCPPHGRKIDFRLLVNCLRSSVSKKVTVLLLHSNALVNQNYWDSCFFSGNPKELTLATGRSIGEEKQLTKAFSVFMRRLKNLEKTGLVEITSTVVPAVSRLRPTKEIVEKLYREGIRWGVENFGYHPRFLHSHYVRFFSQQERTFPLESIVQ